MATFELVRVPELLKRKGGVGEWERGRITTNY
jgi:hypothetical protein